MSCSYSPPHKYSKLEHLPALDRSPESTPPPKQHEMSSQPAAQQPARKRLGLGTATTNTKVKQLTIKPRGKRSATAPASSSPHSLTPRLACPTLQLDRTLPRHPTLNSCSQPSRPSPAPSAPSSPARRSPRPSPSRRCTRCARPPSAPARPPRRVCTTASGSRLRGRPGRLGGT